MNLTSCSQLVGIAALSGNCELCSVHGHIRHAVVLSRSIFNLTIGNNNYIGIVIRDVRNCAMNIFIATSVAV